MYVRSNGKHQSQRSVAAVGEQEELLFVKDSLSGRVFLVDSGYQKSLSPPTDLDRSSRGSRPQLSAANGSSIGTFVIASIAVSFVTFPCQTGGSGP